jgi:hypothetical protein
MGPRASPSRPGAVRRAVAGTAAVARLLVIGAATLGSPSAAGAQVFLASRPDPEFEIGPLFVRASVEPSLGR